MHCECSIVTLLYGTPSIDVKFYSMIRIIFTPRRNQIESENLCASAPLRETQDSRFRRKMYFTELRRARMMNGGLSRINRTHAPRAANSIRMVSPFGQFQPKRRPHLVAVFGGKIPVYRAMQPIHELDLWFPAQ